MTKKDLYENITTSVECVDGIQSYTIDNIRDQLNKFFDSNVCIPKGTEVKVPIWNTGYAVCKVENLVIKPTEPIYEWQWYSVIDGCVDDTTDTWESKQWLTEKEMIAWGNHWHKFEETKRIRQ